MVTYCTKSTSRIVFQIHFLVYTNHINNLWVTPLPIMWNVSMLQGIPSPNTLIHVTFIHLDCLRYSAILNEVFVSPRWTCAFLYWVPHCLFLGSFFWLSPHLLPLFTWMHSWYPTSLSPWFPKWELKLDIHLSIIFSK